MKVQKAAVIGAGAMGGGIAQVLSQAGIEVLLKDIEQSYVDKGLANIKRMYDSRVKKEVMTQSEADRLFGLIEGTTSYDGFTNVDIVIEAALEQINVKVDIFKHLDSICPSRTILATNTSALSISEIGSATRRAEKVVGMHFFNPAQFMKLVEVIPGVRTSNETVEAAVELCKNLKKTAVRVKECPGFLVNRLLFPYLNEALYVLQEGIATPEEVDNAVVEFGMPMGPFTLLDMTGIDVCAHVNEFLYSEYGPRFLPSPLLAKFMQHKQLGQKTGAGFFRHDKDQPAKKGEPKQVNPMLEKLVKEANQNVAPAKSSKKFEALRVLLPMFNEATYALQEDVVQAADVDVAMQLGCGMTNGLLTIAKDKGLDWCLKELEQYQAVHGERFRPSWLLKKLVRAGVKDFSSLEPATVR
ncbi:MAG TPA: 3-hydroxyacyl-CoA dehydrogenase NAD-binding domain-containing protein [Planktothrix sp.]|jgi:3-hydroxyacyl-CoA dehydrogenase